jgi:hypothetical protein
VATLAAVVYIYRTEVIPMKKRAVDLSLDELGAIGATAALKASNEARNAGLAVAGIAEVRQDGHVAPALVQRRPSGIVTGLDWDHPVQSEDVSVPEIRNRADD